MYYVEQDYAGYSEGQHEVWAELCRRRLPEVRATACKAFVDGLGLIGLDERRLPDLAAINARLAPLTGWRAVPVSGYLPAAEFFKCLSERRFPTTITIREAKDIEYTEAPDVFHDVFGHVPLHSDPDFADFLQKYGQVALGASGEQELLELARLFWFTVEFGLIREAGEVRLFGSGLMSSIGEGRHALEVAEKRPFDWREVAARPFEIDKYQPVLYVAESFSQIRESLGEWSSARP